MKKLYFKNKLALYPVTYYVCIGIEAYKQALKTTKFVGNSDILSVNGCVSWYEEDNTMIVYLKAGCEPSTIAHEVFHLADFIGELVGLQYVRESGNEHFAYLIGHLTEQVYANVQTNNTRILLEQELKVRELQIELDSLKE